MSSPPFFPSTLETLPGVIAPNPWSEQTIHFLGSETDCLANQDRLWSSSLARTRCQAKLENTACSPDSCPSPGGFRTSLGKMNVGREEGEECAFHLWCTPSRVTGNPRRFPNFRTEFGEKIIYLINLCSLLHVWVVPSLKRNMLLCSRCGDALKWRWGDVLNISKTFKLFKLLFLPLPS